MKTILSLPALLTLSLLSTASAFTEEVPQDVGFIHLSNGADDSHQLLMACPACLKAVDKREKHLVEGLEIADNSKIFSFTNGRILSLED